MCWSLEVSVFTGTVVLLSTFILWFRNRTYRDRWNAIFLFVFGLMQWIDAALWYLSQRESLNNCSIVNAWITRVGFYIVMLEPIACLVGRMYAQKKRCSWVEAFVYVTCFFILPYVGRAVFGNCFSQPFVPQFEQPKPFFCTQLSIDNHLLLGVGRDREGGTRCWREQYAWGASTSEIPFVLRLFFLLGMVYPYLSMTPLASGILQSTILTITWLFGYFSSSHASIWCHANCVQSITMLLDPYLFPPPSSLFGISSTSSSSYNEEEASDQPSQQRLPSSKAKNRFKYPSILQQRYHRSKIPNELDAIVIGSGIGGLVTAALLARSGKKVLVLEQHYRAGGCTHTFNECGGLFDSGIHYVGNVHVLELLLSMVCQSSVSFQKMGSKEDGYTYDRFQLDSSNTFIAYRASWTSLRKELIKHFPHEQKGIDQYRRWLSWASIVAYFFVLLRLLPRSFPGTKFLTSKIYQWMSPTATQVVHSCVKDPKLRALLSGGQLIDWNLVPDEVSWWVVAAMMNYYMEGGYYPIGGSQTMAEHIVPIIKQAGGHVLCRAEVAQILLEDDDNGDEKNSNSSDDGGEGDGRSSASTSTRVDPRHSTPKKGATKKRAVGVRMKNGDIIRAPIVISNAGASNTDRLLFCSKSSSSSSSSTATTSDSNNHDPSNHSNGNEEAKIPLKYFNTVLPSNGHVTAFITFNAEYTVLGLESANVHSMPDLPKYNFSVTKLQKKFYEDPLSQPGCLITLTFPSAKDPLFNTMFPGQSNVLMLTEGKYEWFQKFENNPYGKRSQEYIAWKAKMQTLFLDRLYSLFPRTKGHVTSIDIGTPLTSQHFLNAPDGESYGMAWTPDRFHPKTLQNLHAQTHIMGLYLTGEASLFGGLLGAMFSGFVTARHILGVPKFLWTLAKIDRTTFFHSSSHVSSKPKKV